MVLYYLLQEKRETYSLRLSDCRYRQTPVTEQTTLQNSHACFHAKGGFCAPLRQQKQEMSICFSPQSFKFGDFHSQGSVNAFLRTEIVPSIQPQI